MGNIEVSPPPQYQRFPLRSYREPNTPSPLRKALTPNSQFYRQHSPIKYAPCRSPLKIPPQITVRSSIPSRISDQNTLKKRARFDEGKGQGDGWKWGEKNDERGWQERQDNRLKCSEIMKKVRNFNDFLLELKEKLRQSSSDASVLNDCKGEVRVRVKLQNERVELQKYKRLVQRELSKTHSIDSINIQQAPKGQQILTIHYQHPQRMSSRSSLHHLPQCKEIPQSVRETKSDFQVLRGLFKTLMSRLDGLNERGVVVEGQNNQEQLGRMAGQNVRVQEVIKDLQSALLSSQVLERKVRQLS